MQRSRHGSRLMIAALLALGACSTVTPTTDLGEVSAPDVDAADGTADAPDGPPMDADAAGDADAGADADADADIGPTDVSDAETSGCPGAFGCTCDDNADCYSGVCIEGRAGFICTALCDLACPDGYDCKNVTTGGDPVSVCVPRHVRLCRPCQADVDCADPNATAPGRCLPGPDPDGGRFCGSACSASIPCLDGYTCETTGEGANASQQCVPSSGQCQCLPEWADKGYVTNCAATGPDGTCPGTRTCGPEGLTACDGAVASPEVCNGLDDDCNGATDDIAALLCTNENEFGTCTGTEACGPADALVICDGPTPAPDVCNGLDDDCDGVTDGGACDDGRSCTVDVCDPQKGCQHTLVENSCVIGEACVLEGESNPADLCETCQPAISTSQWSDAEGKACSDQDPCTSGDTCTGGVCAGSAYDCDDDIPCTTDSCDGQGGCQHTLLANRCLIDGVCHPGLEPNPANPCQACNPANPDDWSAIGVGKTCDDGQLCTFADACDAQGFCTGTTKVCADGLTCTLDVCDGQGGCSFVPMDACVIDGKCVAPGTQKPGDPCMECDPAKSTTAWSGNTGNVCNDANPCTAPDACKLGVCTGTAYSCNDELVCTEDFCDGLGGCQHFPAPGFCNIGGVCRSDGETNPSNPCQICQPAVDAKGWLSVDGKPCVDGDACTTSDICQAGVCAGTVITDDDEPNASLGAAKAIPNTDDCTDWPGDAKTRQATIYPTGDVDWFSFKHSDKTGCDFYPQVEVSGIPSGTNYQLCAYFKCADGSTSLSCDTGTASTSGGLSGCCSNLSGSQSERVKLNPSCDCGTFCFDDTGTVYVEVKAAPGSGASCNSYTLRWGDD
ncbi:MAG: hypothetical protein H6744_20050 [Deltaproteobacteria bacterium]|nr:hypothetical protein [Deltaproteobacteria bacterium]MCB9788977.1 hypothetical protein [Deltaproteobacteria bacterium]